MCQQEQYNKQDSNRLCTVHPAFITTQQHSACYLQTRLIPCYPNLWGFLQWCILTIIMSTSSISLSFLTIVTASGIAFSQIWLVLITSSMLFFSTSLLPHFDHSWNIFYILECDINCARLMLVLATGADECSGPDYYKGRSQTQAFHRLPLPWWQLKPKTSR